MNTAPKYQEIPVHKRNGGKGLPRLLSDVNAQNTSTGLISATLMMTSPIIMLFEVAENGGLTVQQTINWMFAAYLFAGLLGIYMAIRYRIPITGGSSLTGVAFLTTVASQFTYPEMIGGFIMSGLIIYLVGLSGIFTRIIKWVPREVISAMMAGLVASYAVRMVPSFREMPLVGGAALISFLLFLKYSKRISPALGAMVVAACTLGLTQKIEIADLPVHPFLFSWQPPEFTWMALLTLALPLAMLILSNDAAVGVSALQSAGYKPPIKQTLCTSGIFSMITSLAGGQCANIAGMMSAICASSESGPNSKRYMASVVSGIGTILFGIFAWQIVPLIQSLPQALITILAGFSLIGVLLSNLQTGFSGNNFPMSSLLSFLIALSNVSFFHISSVVWALLLGALVSKTIEKPNRPFVKESNNV
ncbi:benzoate/H(+) symporter BenE family transporter [Ammoniphilus sp. YIM 78166]|uniref:benzoate/H(+) symporter BenE family transporter n=1 Tax=Ammoniphilus sp. YIM 78166 TaxID=1644106 RepID=UPI0010703896|nr:benzoate/H(+) symporter BenE family transporter [Ammoniphilus sp. YIM 78166]